MLSPQLAAAHVQFAHCPGHALSSVPSHCSLGWLVWLSPHSGHWQLGRQASGHAASFEPSQSSPALIVPLPHCAPLLKTRIGSASPPGPGSPATLLTELLVVGGIQKVAASTAF